MKFINIAFLTGLSVGTIQAVPLAELTGDAEPAFLDSHLQVGFTGNIGFSPNATDLGTGYWTSASVTGGNPSSATIYTSITFTATGLGPTDSLDLNQLSFDYIRASLNGSNPRMNVFVDLHDDGGYGESLLLVDDKPTSSRQTDAHSIPLNYSLGEGDSITIGFSYADIHGAPQRTHQLDNLVLEGTFDLDSEQPGIDLNNNGVSDIWEYRFAAIDLVKDEASRNQDFDGDGFTNAQEAALGTNPFLAESQLGVTLEIAPSSDLLITVPTVFGKSYEIYESEGLAADDWSMAISPFEGTGSDVELLFTEDVRRNFFRTGVSDIDADGDRLTLWEELNVAGFSDSDPNSAGTTTTTDDFEELKGMVQSALESTVTISAPNTTIYEDETAGIPVTFTRTSPLGDGFLGLETSASYQLIDTTRVASNAASASDYVLVDASGTALMDGVIRLPAGEASTTIFVRPIADSLLEIDEQLTLSIVGHGDLNLWIADARQISSQDYIATSQAGHFLSQASMGGTPATIAALANEIEALGYLPACEAWIDQQLAVPRETTVTDDCFAHQAIYLLGNDVPSINIQNFELVWWGKVTQTKEQLRHRMAFSLSQIFVTSSSFWANGERSDLWSSYTRYYDKLMDGAFSTHRDLLIHHQLRPFHGSLSVIGSKPQRRRNARHLPRRKLRP